MITSDQHQLFWEKSFRNAIYAEHAQTNSTATSHFPNFRSYPIWDVPNSLKIICFLYGLMPPPVHSNLNHDNLAIATV